MLWRGEPTVPLIFSDKLDADYLPRAGSAFSLQQDREKHSRKAQLLGISLVHTFHRNISA